MEMFLNTIDTLLFPDILCGDEAGTDTLFQELGNFNCFDLPLLEFEDLYYNNAESSTSSNTKMPSFYEHNQASCNENNLKFSPSAINLAGNNPCDPTTRKIFNNFTQVTPILAEPVIKPQLRKPIKPTMSISVTRKISPTLAPTTTPVLAPTKVKRRRYDEKLYNQQNHALPKPKYSYSCLAALALKNSSTGRLAVTDMYKFICKHFPYFITAPSSWKNSIRHSLCLNQYFVKITRGNKRKGCLWAINPEKIYKLDEEMQKWSIDEPDAIKRAMAYPEHFEALQKGELKFSRSYDDTDESEKSCGNSEDGSEEGSILGREPDDINICNSNTINNNNDDNKMDYFSEGDIDVAVAEISDDIKKFCGNPEDGSEEGSTLGSESYDMNICSSNSSDNNNNKIEFIYFSEGDIEEAVVEVYTTEYIESTGNK